MFLTMITQAKISNNNISVQNLDFCCNKIANAVKENLHAKISAKLCNCKAKYNAHAKLLNVI